MKFKWIFLFVLLVFPVSIYVFLRAFGENRFEIPIYFQDGLNATLDGCEGQSEGVYRAKFLFDQNGQNENVERAEIVIYDLGSTQSLDPSKKVNVHTFLNKYKTDERVRFVSIYSDQNPGGEFSKYGNAVFYQLEEEEILQFGRCILQVNFTFDSTENKFSDAMFVLCDEERRIRGFYDPEELKEIDRLNTEVRILLDNKNE